MNLTCGSVPPQAYHFRRHFPRKGKWRIAQVLNFEQSMIKIKVDASKSPPFHILMNLVKF